MPDYYIGLMSGTSVDGIDAVLLDFAHAVPKLCAHIEQPWDKAFQQRILNVSQLDQRPQLSELLSLDTEAALGFSQAVQALLDKAKIDASSIKAIGCHGQTLYHQPPSASLKQGNSWQIGDANLIAAQTGICTIADFRRADMAVGGQGAPLVPTYHQALFAEQNNIAVLNIGGIANVSLLANQQHGLIGFDTGPGNALMDAWIAQQKGLDFDKAGKWAASGRVESALLKALLADPYFQKPAPKSSGRDYFNLAWLQQRYPMIANLPAANVQASLQALTAQSIVEAICPFALEQLLVCGGGVHNQALMQALQQQLAYPVRSTAVYAVDPDSLEACCFAWLAQQYLLKQPANSPDVTGAHKAVVLGVMYGSPPHSLLTT